MKLFDLFSRKSPASSPKGSPTSASKSVATPESIQVTLINAEELCALDDAKAKEVITRLSVEDSIQLSRSLMRLQFSGDSALATRAGQICDMLPRASSPIHGKR